MAKADDPPAHLEPWADEDEQNLPLDVAISRQLVREIIAMDHPPGTWLREQDLAERFGVSRSPVREALRHVAKAGFVEMHPWRGARVVELTLAETQEIFDLLEVLFGVVARVAATQMPEEKMRLFDEWIERGERVTRPGVARKDRVAFSFDLGRFIGRWGASKTAYEMVVRVGNLAMWQHRFFRSDDAYTVRSMELHRVLISAIRARDPAIAESAARAIVSLGRERVLPEVPHS